MKRSSQKQQTIHRLSQTVHEVLWVQGADIWGCNQPIRWIKKPEKPMVCFLQCMKRLCVTRQVPECLSLLAWCDWRRVWMAVILHCDHRIIPEVVQGFHYNILICSVFLLIYSTLNYYNLLLLICINGTQTHSLWLCSALWCLLSPGIHREWMTTNHFLCWRCWWENVAPLILHCSCLGNSEIITVFWRRSWISDRSLRSNVPH